MKYKYLLIFLLFSYNLTRGQVPGTPRLIGKNSLSQAYILGKTMSNDLNSATVTGFVLNNGQSSVTTCGIVWGTNALFDVNNSATYINKTIDGDVTGANSYTANVTDLLAQSSTIYISAYASNSYGTFYSNAIRIQKQVVTTGTGKTWMTTNLGATAIPESVTDTAGYGFLFQWGRKADGHQYVRPEPSGTILAQSDEPAHGLFILGGTGGNSYYDWRITKNTNLWNGVSGANNPCPTGFRLPLTSEFEDEIAIINPKTGAGGFASSLALTYGGERRGGQFTNPAPGSLVGTGTIGSYWLNDSPSTGNVAYYISFSNTGFGVNNSVRSVARSVRCIKN
jgi:uncharacterized protein (TIGR02145 family)